MRSISPPRSSQRARPASSAMHVLAAPRRAGAVVLDIRALTRRSRAGWARVLGTVAIAVGASAAVTASAGASTLTYRIVSATIYTKWQTFPAGDLDSCSVSASAEQHDTLAPGGLGVRVGGDFVDIRPNVTSRTTAAYQMDCAAGSPFPSFTCSGEEPHPADGAVIFGQLAGRHYRFAAGDILWATSAVCSNGQTNSIAPPDRGASNLTTDVHTALIATKRIRTGATPHRTIHLQGHQVTQASAGDQQRYEIDVDWSVVLHRTATGGRRR